jgi:hypothetical protein
MTNRTNFTILRIDTSIVVGSSNRQSSFRDEKRRAPVHSADVCTYIKSLDATTITVPFGYDKVQDYLELATGLSRYAYRIILAGKILTPVGMEEQWNWLRYGTVHMVGLEKEVDLFSSTTFVDPTKCIYPDRFFRFLVAKYIYKEKAMIYNNITANNLCFNVDVVTAANKPTEFRMTKVSSIAVQIDNSKELAEVYEWECHSSYYRYSIGGFLALLTQIPDLEGSIGLQNDSLFQWKYSYEHNYTLANCRLDQGHFLPVIKGLQQAHCVRETQELAAVSEQLPKDLLNIVNEYLSPSQLITLIIL